MGITKPSRSRSLSVRAWKSDPISGWRNGMAMALPSLAMLPLLFVPQLGNLGPVLFLLACVLSFLPITAAPLDNLVRAWPVLVIAGFALISTLWSIAPQTTLRYAIQMALTILTGVMIGASGRPRHSLWGVFLALGFYAIVSLAFGGNVALGAGQDTAFAGLNSGKNYLADIVAIGLLAGLACTIMAVNAKRPLAVAGVALVLVVQVYILLIARSSGAILGIVLASGFFLGLLAFGQVRGGLKAILALAMIVGSSVAIASIATEGQAIRSELLRVMGKDDTLTGRVYLWYRSDAIMREHPMLGTGFGAFWVQGQADAEGLWAYSGIQNRSGFNFHNTQIEQRVNLGWVGFLLIATITLGCTGVLIFGSFFRPTVTGAFWTAFIIYELSRVSYEAIGPGPFNFGTVMMAAGMSFATSRARIQQLTDFLPNTLYKGLVRTG